MAIFSGKIIEAYYTNKEKTKNSSGMEILKKCHPTDYRCVS